MSYRANGTRANGHRANGNRTDVVAPHVVVLYKFPERYMYLDTD